MPKAFIYKFINNNPNRKIDKMAKVNIKQHVEEGGMDNWVYTEAQEAVDEKNISYLRMLVDNAETWPRDVICEEYRKVHGTAKAQADLGVTFLN